MCFQYLELTNIFHYSTEQISRKIATRQHRDRRSLSTSASARLLYTSAASCHTVFDMWFHEFSLSTERGKENKNNNCNPARAAAVHRALQPRVLCYLFMQLCSQGEVSTSRLWSKLFPHCSPRAFMPNRTRVSVLLLFGRQNYKKRPRESDEKRREGNDRT